MHDEQAFGGKGIYEIKVKGELDEQWADWFSGLSMVSDGHTTTLTGFVPDQAKLRGILASIWDLNLTVLSVVHIAPE
jgi:hypothetical protein